MKHELTLEIKSGQVEAYELMLDYTEEDMVKYGIPRLDTIKTWTKEFDNGVSFDLSVKSSEDDVWCEGCLYDKDGIELATSNVRDEIGGEWLFQTYDGEKYTAKVVPID